MDPVTRALAGGLVAKTRLALDRRPYVFIIRLSRDGEVLSTNPR